MLCYRVVEKRAGIADLAYSGLLLLMILGIAQRSIESTAIDIRMAAYGGGMCLVANATPRRAPFLFALMLPLCSAVLRELK